MKRHILSNPLTFIASLLAVLLVIGVFALEFIDSRTQSLENGSRQVQYHGHMLAEHVARSFDSIEILLDELKPQISELNPWWKWSPEQGFEILNNRLTRSLPHIRHLLIFDADGEQRFTSFALSAPAINIRDRPYFVQLRNGASKTRFGPYVGRNSNRPTYAVAHSLSFPDQRFAGALVVAIEPGYFEELCWSTRPYEEFESALINAEGRIIGLCRPSLERDREGTIGEDFRTVVARGAFAGLPPELHTTLADTKDFILSTEVVPGYPDLRVISTIPKARLLADWHDHARHSLILAAAALAALAIAALLIRRQFGQLHRLTVELQEHRDTLEQRVLSATAELEQRRSEAEGVAEAKSRFLASASHDLRQPLQALRLFVGRLRDNSVQEERTVLIQRIEQAANAMGEQLESLLELSRLDMADVRPQKATLQIGEIFRQLAATYRPAAEANCVRLVFSQRQRVIFGDSVLLTRLLGNLIDNAIKFSPRGTVFVCARWRSGGETRIEVRDNGVGIAPEYQRAVYEEFFQIGNPARESHAGTGLGLSIVSRIAHLLSAPLTLRSHLGAGSVFSLTLPAVPDLIQPKIDRQKPKLLLIGTDQQRIAALSAQFADWGYVVESGGEFKHARARLAESPAIPVLVAHVDCESGEHLRALFREHPGIVIGDAECKLRDLGPYHLTEPVKPARLHALLRSLH